MYSTNTNPIFAAKALYIEKLQHTMRPGFKLLFEVMPKLKTATEIIFRDHIFVGLVSMRSYLSIACHNECSNNEIQWRRNNGAVDFGRGDLIEFYFLNCISYNATF